MSNGFGIVMLDLGGGDIACSFVDAERWRQLRNLHASVDETISGWKDRLVETIGWLTADESPDTHRPEGMPKREGKLLCTLYTQTYVIEYPKGKTVAGYLLGILSIP